MATKKKPAFKKLEEKPQIFKPNIKRNWSDFQKNIFKDIAKSTDHTVVIARAGCGKTSTIVEGFKYIPRGKKTLMVAFNKSIATELKERAASYIDVMTLHSLGFRAVKQAFGEVTLDNDKSRLLTASIIGDDYDLWELNQSICKCVSLCKGFLFDTPAKIEELIEKFGIEMFELKPEQFIQHVIKVLSLAKAQKKVIDFDDMIWFPFVYRLNVGKFDVVFVDEAQDLNAAQIVMVMSAIKNGGRIIAVGDPHQCVHEDTELQTKNGAIKIKDVLEGEEIKSYSNGELVFSKILKKVRSNKTEGVYIHTKSGNSLCMTYEHKIWALPPNLDNQYVVYLMYRPDMGFRVGKTNSWKSAQKHIFGSRPSQEGASKLWVLDIVNTNEEALFLEQQYSLKFGIPTSVFNASSRGIDQERVDKIFGIFGQNGQLLLIDKKLHFDYPNWMASSFTSNNKSRQTIRVNAHAKKGSQVTLEWSDDSITKIIVENNIPFSTGKNNRIRKYFKNYTDAMNFANFLSSMTNAQINERLSCADEMPYLLTASSLKEGMKVVINCGDEVIFDEIEFIDKVNGDTYYDLEIENTSNFFGDNILSHNSIYQFRGADSEAMTNIINKLTAKTLPLSVTYRCPKKIVKLAQEVVPDIEAHESAPDGLVVDLSTADLLKTVKPGDFILSRTNAPLVKYCMALLKSGVPANIQGRDVGANLLYFIKKSKAKTINAFIQYVNEWKDQEVKRLLSEKKDTGTTLDKAECLLNLCDGTLTIKDLKDTISKLFDDTDDEKKVILSTTHKAKGLERDRVFVLAGTYRYGPGVTGEEANLWYVAITRAKKELYLVRKPSKLSQYDDEKVDIK